MKVSSVIDKNTISGTILLDKICELNIKLLHEINNSGVKKYIILDSVTVNPSNKYFDYSFLNPAYYSNLFVDVNNTKYSVLEPEIEYTSESNPLNDRIYTESELPDLDNVVISDENIENSSNDFGYMLSHSSVSNLVDINSFTSNYHIAKNDNISFDINNDMTVSANLKLNFAPEITIALNGDKPNSVKLYLINSRGDERLVSNFTEYFIDNNFCYSGPITSSTKNARIELTYPKDEFKLKTARINSILVSNISQYFGKSNAERYVDSVQVSTTKKMMYVFNSDMFPMFGLRTILSLGDSNNGHVVQISNGKILFKSIKNGLTSQLLTSNKVSSQINIGIFISSTNTIIYSNGEAVKDTNDDLSIDCGTYTASIGCIPSDQDFDSNSKISFSVYNRDIYE